MGQIQIITQKQKALLLGLSESVSFGRKFYFTGGTALSAYYLQHRFSDDLDFFSEQEFDRDETFRFIEDMARKQSFTFTMENKEVVQMFFLTYPDGSSFKMDFAHYPYQRVEPGMKKDGITVDSLLDIGINKTVALIQRNEVKDFVDYYYLEQKLGFWDLREGVLVKFRMELDPIFFASDLLKVEEFTSMPRMIKKLSLSKLKSFFRAQALEVGKKAVI